MPSVALSECYQYVKYSTPFLPCFRKVLFGRAPVRAIEEVRECLKGNGVLGALAITLEKAMGGRMKSAERCAGMPVRRDRLFTDEITFLAFLSQILDPGSACREAVRRVQLW